MCKMASGFINPRTLEVKVKHLDSHSDTADALGLKDTCKPNDWREMHYTPEGEIECRVLPVDSHTSEECVSAVRAKWPTFVSFFNWAVANGGISTTLDLSSLTSADGLVIPDGVKWLYLSSKVRSELDAKRKEA